MMYKSTLPIRRDIVPPDQREHVLMSASDKPIAGTVDLTATNIDAITLPRWIRIHLLGCWTLERGMSPVAPLYHR